MQLAIKAPSLHFRTKADDFRHAIPDNTGKCGHARTIKRVLEDKGVCSISVKPNFVKFNMVLIVEGMEKLFRLRYEMPHVQNELADKFDVDDYEHGRDYAIAKAVEAIGKGMDWTLQSRTGSVHELVVQPSGDRRKPRGRVRASPKVKRIPGLRCARRYHPTATKKAA